MILTIVTVAVSRLTWVVIISSFMWLALLFVLTFADYLTRGWQLY